jgi:hypothetical protein
MDDNFETFRDHFLSLYQSAVTAVAKRIDAAPGVGGSGRRFERSAESLLPGVATEIARRAYAQELGLPPTSDSGHDRALSKSDWAFVCADLAFRYMKAKANGDNRAIAQVTAELTASECDPAWARTIEEYLQYFGPSGTRRSIPYIRAADVGARTIEIPAGASLALVADWGTGAEPAIQLLNLISLQKPDVFVHLGDIYYSGTPAECETAFKALIDAILRHDKPDLPTFTLAGNHDMYCGGVGYYELINKLNKKPTTQSASFFCLRSSDEKWQLLGLDTGLHDYSPFSVGPTVTYLEEDELAWHCERIREFSGRTILLSHHQPFSAFSTIGRAGQDGQQDPTNPHLMKAFEAFKTEGRVVGWFWGHEHALSIYKPFKGIERGRCIGHGAVPVSTKDDIYLPLSGIKNLPEIIPNTLLSKQGAVWAHGFVMLKLGADEVKASYYQDLDGRLDLVYSETLS